MFRCFHTFLKGSDGTGTNLLFCTLLWFVWIWFIKRVKRIGLQYSSEAEIETVIFNMEEKLEVENQEKGKVL